MVPMHTGLRWSILTLSHSVKTLHLSPLCIGAIWSHMVSNALKWSQNVPNVSKWPIWALWYALCLGWHWNFHPTVWDEGQLWVCEWETQICMNTSTRNIPGICALSVGFLGQSQDFSVICFLKLWLLWQKTSWVSLLEKALAFVWIDNSCHSLRYRVSCVPTKHHAHTIPCGSYIL